MYQNLGIHWASSIPAFLALMCVPFPFLFYKYGKPIRMRCKFAAEAAEALKRFKGESAENSEGRDEEEGQNTPDEKKEEAGRIADPDDKEAVERGEKL